jgi:hypothetical protein
VKPLKSTKLILASVIVAVLLLSAQPAFCWSNGGYSADPVHPDYGTHDWIAQHALDYLPAVEKQYITGNLASYLLGTELPDNSNQTIGGIGDTTKHHIYFHADGSLQDDSAAVRASEEYQKALMYLKNKDYPNAAKETGVMTHYIADVGVFGHVMGAKTDWGAEDSSKHSSYEDYVNTRTASYDSTFNIYLHFDGDLLMLSAYDDARNLAYNTTFGDNGDYTCTWMNSNYDWSNLAFKNRCGEELNLAVNAVVDALHRLYMDASIEPTVLPLPSIIVPTDTPTPTGALTSSQTPTVPEFPTQVTLILSVWMAMVIALVFKKKRLCQGCS